MGATQIDLNMLQRSREAGMKTLLLNCKEVGMRTMQVLHKHMLIDPNCIHCKILQRFHSSFL